MVVVICQQEDRIAGLESDLVSTQQQLKRARRMIASLQSAKRQLAIERMALLDHSRECLAELRRGSSFAKLFGAMLMSHRLGLPYIAPEKHQD
jgi:hypothetical protein